MDAARFSREWCAREDCAEFDVMTNAIPVLNRRTRASARIQAGRIALKFEQVLGSRGARPSGAAHGPWGLEDRFTSAQVKRWQ